MFMRQILADVIPKFQKITRQMLCDKCSKSDVILIPQNADVLWREDPQNAAAIWGVLYYLRFFIQIMHLSLKYRKTHSNSCNFSQAEI
jgi:hypothetical protein